MKKTISTDNAPAAIGAYSQAVVASNHVYVSGQIPLDPATGDIVSPNFADQARQVFRNLTEIAKAANASLDDAVKLTVYLTDLNDFAQLNDIMADFVSQPYPARAAVQVSALPKGVKIEIDAVLVIE